MVKKITNVNIHVYSDIHSTHTTIHIQYVQLSSMYCIYQCHVFRPLSMSLLHLGDLSPVIHHTYHITHPEHRAMRLVCEEDIHTQDLHQEVLCTCIPIYIHVLVLAKGRKKEASKVKQTSQSNTVHVCTLLTAPG